MIYFVNHAYSVVPSVLRTYDIPAAQVYITLRVMHTRFART